MNLHILFRRVLFSLLLLFVGLQSLASAPQKKVTVNLEISSASPRIIYGLSKIKELSDENLIAVSDQKPDITLNAVIDSCLAKESFSITTSGQQTTITAGDDVGVMYALLSIRDALRQGKHYIEDKSEHPDLSFRAIKHNLPWNSYRNSEALSLHYDTCRDTLYWCSFLDMMAENRFNVLTLWNLHPFSYLVKTEKYPEACPFSDLEMKEWRTLWTCLFRMAKERGIETYLINWNIFVSPEFSKAHHVAEYCIDNNYYVSHGDTSAIIKDYTREVVKATLDEYPDLTGLGITLGEGMGGMTPQERQDWVIDAFVGGMREASRKAKFIYRVPLSAGTGSEGSTSTAVEQMARTALDTLSCFSAPITIELKFNWSHAYSATTLEKVHGGKLNDTYWDPLPDRYSLAWMLRNEDFFMLRWGNTDFLREHIVRNSQPYVSGYFIGSECYIPAKDYITSVKGASARYAFDRQWMYYKQAGRLLYNASTPDECFAEEFERRYPSWGQTLFQAQQRVSHVPLIVASFQNASWDFTLYSEGLLNLYTKEDGRRGVKLISLKEMTETKPLDKRYMSIDQYIDNGLRELKGMIAPLHLADSIDCLCLSALNEVGGIPTMDNTDLMYEVSDIKAWAYIGQYYANKLRAAVSYRLFVRTGDRSHLTESVELLQKATDHWRSLVLVTTPVYRPVPLVHLSEDAETTEYFHWSIIEAQVLSELDNLKKEMSIGQ